jgi:hypothetical protein
MTDSPTPVTATSPPGQPLPGLDEVLARLRLLPPGDWLQAVRSDQAARWRAGQGIPVETYLQRLPALAGSPEDVQVLLCGEAMLRRERGETPELAEYQRRFPHLAGQLALPLGLLGALAEVQRPEQPTVAQTPVAGASAALPVIPGYWNNRNGQALIKALNSGTGTQLGDWLAATLPNTFGKNAGGNDLAGQSNAYIAALFQQDFVMKGVKLDAQVLATALSVYATNATLDPTKVAASYGFTVSGDGAGTATANVGSNGDAFGVANNTTLTLMDLLLAADAQAVSGVLYNGNAARRNAANAVFSAVNQAGGIS